MSVRIHSDPFAERFVNETDEKARRLHQIELEKLYSKNQTVSRIRSEFTNCELFKFEKYLEKQRIPVDFGLDLLVQMVLHKRCSPSTMVGILRHHFEPAPDASQLCADMLERALVANLMGWDARNQQFVVIIDITEDVQRDLDRFQFPLPMVVPPRRVRDNEDTGYFTCRGSIILRKNHHSDDVCLDHINRVNRIRFSIDHVTARMIKNRWRNLDKPKDGESQEEFAKRVKAFDKYDRTSKEVIDKLLAHGNEFYLTHRYDKRGRIYCQGYHVNYQGAPWNKAVIELADKEYVN
jgi:hypothetical protein